MTTNADFSWSSVPDAIGYKYEIKNLYTSVIEQDGYVSAPLTTVSISGLFVQTDYEFSVKTVCNSEGSESEYVEIIEKFKPPIQLPPINLRVMAIGSHKDNLEFTFATNSIADYTDFIFVDTLSTFGSEIYYEDYKNLYVTTVFGTDYVIDDNTLYIKSAKSTEEVIPFLHIYVNWKGTESITPTITNRITLTDVPLDTYVPIDFSLFGINLTEAIYGSHTLDIAIVQETLLTSTPALLSTWLFDEYSIIFP